MAITRKDAFNAATVDDKVEGCLDNACHAKEKEELTSELTTKTSGAARDEDNRRIG